MPESELRTNHGRPKLVIIAILVATVVSSSILLSSYRPDTSPVLDGVRITYTSHPTIRINGDSQFDNTLYPSNGVVSGDGTPSDPYLIEGWEIAPTSSSTGIWIEATTAHFVVRNCLVRSADYTSGIVLMYVLNGTIEGNNCSGNMYGVRGQGSSDCVVADNNCSSGSGTGIYWHESSRNVTIANNTCSSNTGQGIVCVVQMTNSSITGNTCGANSIGVVVDSVDNVTVSGNVCESNTNLGVLISSSDNCSVIGNVCNYNLYGVIVSNSVGITISENSCGSNEYMGVLASNSPMCVVSGNNCTDNAQMGVQIASSHNATVLSNSCSGSEYFGVYLSGSPDSVVANNSCSDNAISGVYLGTSDRVSVAGNSLSENTHGVFIQSSSYCEVQLNRIENQTSWGVRIEVGSGNTIWNNTFVGNNAGGSQACDNGTDNRWNTSGSPHGYGNYWSDWTSPDGDMDGVVDHPYVIDGTAGAVDDYPLTDSPTVPIPEFGSLSVVTLSLLGMVLLARTVRRRNGR